MESRAGGLPMKIRNYSILSIVVWPLWIFGALIFIHVLRLWFYEHMNSQLDYIIFVFPIILAFVISEDKINEWVVYVWFIIFVFAVFSGSDRLFIFLIAFFAWLAAYSLKFSTLNFLESLSVIYIDERGIIRKHLYRKEIFIAWEEFSYIGVGEIRTGCIGSFSFLLYFSKIPLKKIHYHEFDVLNQTKEHFLIQYKKGLLEEILKHVGEERIKDVERIKNSENPCDRQDSSLSTRKHEKVLKKLIERWRAKRGR